LKLRYVDIGEIIVCEKYPKCKCEGHLVYEKNKLIKKLKLTKDVEKSKRK